MLSSYTPRLLRLNLRATEFQRRIKAYDSIQWSSKSSVRFLNSTTRTHEFFDVCIVGAGICGATLANLIVKHNESFDSEKISLCIVDINGLQTYNPKSIDIGRVFAISNQNKSIFKEIGIWDRIRESMMTHPMYNIRVWDSRNNATFKISSNPSNPLSYITNAGSIIYELHQNLINGTASNNLKIIEKTSVKNIDLSLSFPTISFSNGETVKTRLLIGADGIKSIVRKAACIDGVRYDYNQKGVIATLRTNTKVNRVGMQRFLSTGPICILPLNDYGLVSLVWTLPSHIAENIVHLPPDQLSVIINTALNNQEEDYQFLIDRMTKKDSPNIKFAKEMEWGLDRLLKFGDLGYSDFEFERPRILEVFPNTIKAFDLCLWNSDTYISKRTALVGDSAHVVHPLAGQGLNMGLQDVKCLFENLKLGASSGSDLGGEEILRKYQKTRYPGALSMMGVIHAIKVIFGSHNLALISLRSLSMWAVDSSRLLRKAIKQFARSAPQ